MKYATVLVVLSFLFISFKTLAQRNNLYADAGFNPGFSITYNYKLAKHFSVGGGIQGYNFHPTPSNSNQFVPAIFGDIRFNLRPAKKNQFFPFIDLGIDIYQQHVKYRSTDSIIYNQPHNNGFYTGYGIGYLRRMTKRGGGPYASIKLIFNWSEINGYNTVSKKHEVGVLDGDGAFIFSLGFRF